MAAEPSSPATMKAMLLADGAAIERHPLQWTDLPVPEPGAGEVRLKVSCCAICRTDLHIIEGDLPIQKRPVVPGHQVVGVIDAIGEQCRRLRPGLRVGVAWLRHTCGACRFCTSGRENLCPSSAYTGYHADGGYAQYATVPEAFAYELPDGYSDVEVAPLLCSGIIGYRALKRCHLERPGKLGIFGFGSSAHIVLQIARHRGHEVFVVTRSQNHQLLATAMGASWCGEDATKLPARLDAAIVFAPAGSVVPTALKTLDSGGVASLAGIHMTPIPSLDYQADLYGERDIHPVTANTREDGRELLAEAAAAKVIPRTVEYRLDQANQALIDLKQGRLDGTGVLVMGD
jgi:propanol-preferring alcohol dehydrogenase